MADFWPKKTSSRIAMVCVWAGILAAVYYSLPDSSPGIPPVPRAVTDKSQDAKYDPTTPEERLANKNDVGPYGTQLSIIELSAFGVYCGRVNTMIAQKDLNIMEEQMVEIANPGVPSNISDPTMDQKIKDAKVRGKERAGVECGWWNTNPGKSSIEELTNLARY